ncbi:MAG: hypothetical protein HKM86_04330 [Deltaproteobacteria bacterium]|nr:hypothetical protein [Deltaproteobacteria bacterium]
MEKDRKKLHPDQELYRFGSIAVYRKYVTLEQVQLALAKQIEDNVNGEQHRLLGDILLEKNWITDEQVKSILSEMGVEKE